MRSGQKAGKAFLNVDAPFAQVIVEEGGERVFIVEIEIEPAGVAFDFSGHPATLEQIRQTSRQSGRFAGEIFLQ